MADKMLRSEAEPSATEIEITAEMIEAGAKVIWECFEGRTIAYGSSFGEHVAASVYRAMASCRADAK